MEEDSSISRIETITAATTISLVILGIIQIILGETISRSVALTANGIDCIGDGFVSGIVWIGLKFLKKELGLSKKHFLLNCNCIT